MKFKHRNWKKWCKLNLTFYYPSPRYKSICFSSDSLEGGWPHGCPDSILALGWQEPGGKVWEHVRYNSATVSGAFPSSRADSQASLDLSLCVVTYGLNIHRNFINNQVISSGIWPFLLSKKSNQHLLFIGCYFHSYWDSTLLSSSF